MLCIMSAMPVMMARVFLKLVSYHGTAACQVLTVGFTLFLLPHSIQLRLILSHLVSGLVSSTQQLERNAIISLSVGITQTLKVRQP